MFTNEFDWDETITVVLDDEGMYEDVSIFIDGTDVYLRQWNENLERYEVISMSHTMWVEMQLAMKTSEGAFKVELE
jgi:hypothetical protein